MSVCLLSHVAAGRNYTWTDGPPAQETACGRFGWLTWLFSKPPPVTLQSHGLEIVGLVGEGGMGRVFHAKGVDRQGKRIDVILKEPKPGDFNRQLLNDELTILQRLYPGRARRITNSDGSWYVVMDMVLARPQAPGEGPFRAPSIDDLLTTGLNNTIYFGGPRPTVQQIQDAVVTEMQRIHAAGIVHADIKPENILISHRADGTWGATIIDFGLSSSPEVTPTPAPNMMRGTVPYMSREAIRNQWTPTRDIRALQRSLLETYVGARFDDSQIGLYTREIPGIGLWYMPQYVFDDHPRIPPHVAMVLQSHLPRDANTLQTMLTEARGSEAAFINSYVQRWQTAFAERTDSDSRHELALEILMARNLGPRIFSRLSAEGQQFVRERGQAFIRPGSREGHFLFGYNSNLRSTVSATLAQLP